jgi:hypothetical protein
MRSLATIHPLARPAIVAILLSALLLAEAFWFAERHSLTYDETIYLNLSLQSLRAHRLDPEFMRLGVAPLPSLLTYAGPLLLTAPAESPRPSAQAGRVFDPQLIRAPRFLNSLLIAVPLLLVVFIWLHRRRGLMTAFIGAGLIALSPTLVVHGSLATTDESLALFSTLALAAIAWYASGPSAARLLVCAAAVATAMSAKYTAAYLIPVAGAVFLLSSAIRLVRQRAPASALGVLGHTVFHIVLFVCIVLPLWWAGHFFARVTPGELSDPAGSVSQLSRSRPPEQRLRGFVLSLAPVAGIQRQIAHVREGDSAYLLGERSTSGWWYYFPLMFAFKSTPAELFLAMVLLFAGVVGALHPWRTLTALDSSMQTLLVAAIVFVGALVTSHLNQGHRYMIPLYPMLILAGCDQLAARLKGRAAPMMAVGAVLLVSQAWSNLTIAPHYLAYVNSFSGGPENAWRLMADSSLDWGQDLPDLADYLKAHDRGPVAIKYFGTALPEAYGVSADEIERLRGRPEDYGVLALSVTYLDGLHLSGRDPFKDFRRLEPVAQVGHSIMVYDLKRPGALAAFRDALKAFHT